MGVYLAKVACTPAVLAHVVGPVAVFAVSPEIVTVGVLVPAVAPWALCWARGVGGNGASSRRALLAVEGTPATVVTRASTVPYHHLAVASGVVTVWSLLDCFHDSAVHRALVHLVDLLDIDVRESSPNSDQVNEIRVGGFHCYLSTAEGSFPIVHN